MSNPSSDTNDSLSAYHPGDYVFDNFEKLVLRPDASAYWWIAFAGAENSRQSFAENSNSMLQGSMNIEQNVDQSFLRMELCPQTIPSIFTMSSLTEQRDGFSYGEAGSWTPD